MRSQHSNLSIPKTALGKSNFISILFILKMLPKVLIKNEKKVN